jgi:hypothetical protein
MDTRVLGFLDRFPAMSYVIGIYAGKTANHGAPDLAGYCPYRIKVAGTGRGKTRLHDVHSQVGELAGNPQFLGSVHGGPARLLAITQRGIENFYNVGHGSAPDMFAFLIEFSP